MTKLNKDTFEARFNEVCAGIASAEQALGQASFQATTGYATQDDVDKARGHLTALQNQRDDLKRAWAVQQEEDQKQFMQRRTDNWQAAIETTEGLLAQQAIFEQTIAAAVNAIGGAYRGHIAASEQMKEVLKPFFHGGGQAGLERLRNMMETVAPKTASIRFSIAGAFALQKLDLTGVNVAAAEQRVRERGIFDHTEHRAAQIRALLERNTVD